MQSRSLEANHLHGSSVHSRYTRFSCRHGATSTSAASGRVGALTTAAGASSTGCVPEGERIWVVMMTAGIRYIKVAATHIRAPAHSWSWRGDMLRRCGTFRYDEYTTRSQKAR